MNCKIATILTLLLFSTPTFASKSPCSIDDTEAVAVEYLNIENSNSTISLSFPLIDNAELIDLRLSYGFGSGYEEELSVELATNKHKEGYQASVTVFENHKPVFLRAMYQTKNHCHASIEVRIEKQTVWQEPNS